MKTTFRWKCPSCDAAGSVELSLPFSLRLLESRIHASHWSQRDAMERSPSVCTPIEIDVDAIPDVPELRGAKPLVLYFGTDADREEFSALVRAAKPGMVARNL